MNIGLIGDYDPAVVAHRAIPQALALAGASLGKHRIETTWLATKALERDALKQLLACDGLWCVPASPYASLEGALGAIRFARENQVPFLGTCGGFQHALMEYARNELGLVSAAHAEIDPGAAHPLISRLACALIEKDGRIRLQDGSRVRQIYGLAEITEVCHCNFGLNPAYEARLADGRLRFTGRDPAGEVRALELDEHPFFIGTLFQPERSGLRGEVHPLIRAYLEAVLGRGST